ncbi:MAG: hypothetical protein P1U74_11215 [Legionellaceae bacterium]|nr:hypothetical protein [Legionellaceae bacterium]
MTSLFKEAPQIQEHTIEVQYHHKALNACDNDFPYRTDIKSNLAEHYSQIAHIYYREHNFDEALKYYLKAINYNCMHFQALNQIGLILTKKCQFKQAITYYQQIVDLATTSPNLEHKTDALLSIALVYIKENREGYIRKAAKYIDLALDLAPNDKLALELLQKIEDLNRTEDLIKNTQISILNKNWADASKYIKQAKQISPDNRKVLETDERLRSIIANLALSQSTQKIMFNVPQQAIDEEKNKPVLQFEN